MDFAKRDLRRYLVEGFIPKPESLSKPLAKLFVVVVKKKKIQPWLVWLGGLSASL